MQDSNPQQFDVGALMAPIRDWRGAICDSHLPASARHVALTLSLHLSTRRQTAFPGADCLAKETGLTSRTVRSQLQLLVAAGYLQLLHRGGIKGEKKTANVYRTTVPKSVADLWTSTPETVSPVKSTTPTPETDRADGGNGFTPTRDLTSEELAGSSFLPGSGRVTEFKPVPFAEEKIDLATLREQRKEATKKEQAS